jgi:hypothetical protein
MFCHIVWQILTDVSEECTASIIRMLDDVGNKLLIMEAGNTSETLVNFYETTWRNNPEDSQSSSRTSRVHELPLLSFAQYSFTERSS